LKVKVKGQGHKGQKTAFSGPFGACMWFMLGKTSLGSGFYFFSLFVLSGSSTNSPATGQQMENTSTAFSIVLHQSPYTTSVMIHTDLESYQCIVYK